VEVLFPTRYLVGSIVIISVLLLAPYCCLVSVGDGVVGSHISGPSPLPMCTYTMLGACHFGGNKRILPRLD